MVNLLLKLILIYTVIYFGISMSELAFCRKGVCTDKLERAAREVVEIQWKPISVWPEEAKRFR